MATSLQLRLAELLPARPRYTLRLALAVLSAAILLHREPPARAW